MNIILLTHEKELLRKSGTGKLVKKVLNNICTIILWKRKDPSKVITSDIDIKKTVLLYPTDKSTNNIILENMETIIVIDGTWQEANKIYNRSPYLHSINKIELSTKKASIYKLRRNQKNMGLSTLESVAELYKLKEDNITHDLLINELVKFQKSY